jgi:hypothetical protein
MILMRYLMPLHNPSIITHDLLQQQDSYFCLLHLQLLLPAYLHRQSTSSLLINNSLIDFNQIMCHCELPFDFHLINHQRLCIFRVEDLLLDAGMYWPRECLIMFSTARVIIAVNDLHHHHPHHICNFKKKLLLS